MYFGDDEEMVAEKVEASVQNIVELALGFCTRFRLNTSHTGK